MIRRYPCIFLLFFIVPGIVLADLTRLPSWLFMSALLVSGLVSYAGWRFQQALVSTLAFGFVFLFFSALHYSVRFYDVGPHHIANVLETDKLYRIFGRVADWPDLKSNRTEVKLSLDSLTSDVTRKARGTILVKVHDTTTTVQRGDRLAFQARIYPLRGGSVPGTFDYRRYLHLKGVYGVAYLPTLLNVHIDRANRYGLFGYIDRLREWIRNCFYRSLSPDAAALAAGFLIGETHNIPVSVYRLFRDTGTLHVLAVSGSNVALVLLAFALIMRPLALSQRLRFLSLLGVVLLFALLSYEEPSVIRASVMAALVIAAKVVQRRYDLNNIIAAAAVIILLYNPTQLFDVGFQLSFVTAWGLIFITPKVSGFFQSVHSHWWYRWLILPFIVSVVAWLCSTPLIALYFHRVPVVSILANLVIVPLVSLAVMGIILLLLASLIWPMLGMLVGTWLNQLLKLIVTLLTFFAGEQPLLFKTGNFSTLYVVFIYLFLVLLVWSLTAKRVRKIAVTVLLVFVNIGLLGKVVSAFQGEPDWVVTCFSVPGGEAAVVRAPASSEGDIIIAGLAGKDYQIEDRIFQPVLDGLQIKKVHSLMVTTADYDAVDDIIRLGENYGVEIVYVADKLRRSFNDVTRISFSGRINARIVPYSQFWEPLKEGIGYYPFESGVAVNFDSVLVVFADTISSSFFDWCRPDRQAVLVINQPTAVDSSLQQLLLSKGFFRVVCSKVKQERGSSAKFAETTQPGRDFIFDLSVYGALRLEIETKGANPLRVKPLR
jgi:competence protein ComEC